MFLLTRCVLSFPNTQFARFIFHLLTIALTGTLPKASLKTAQIRNQIPESRLIPNPRIILELHGGIKLPKIEIRKAKNKQGP